MSEVNVKLLKVNASTGQHNEAYINATVFVGNNSDEPIVMTVQGFGFIIETPDGRSIETEPEHPNLVGAFLLDPGQDVTKVYSNKAICNTDVFVPGPEYTLIALGPEGVKADRMTFKFHQLYL
jgi:hypothetical protein